MLVLHLCRFQQLQHLYYWDHHHLCHHHYLKTLNLDHSVFFKDIRSHKLWLKLLSNLPYPGKIVVKAACFNIEIDILSYSSAVKSHFESAFFVEKCIEFLIHYVIFIFICLLRNITFCKAVLDRFKDKLLLTICQPVIAWSMSMSFVISEANKSSFIRAIT